jgi:hypothetical protein
MTDKLAVVTGASAGIGWEMAKQLAARGYNVWLIARREERLRRLATQITSETGRTAVVFALNLIDAVDRAKLVTQMGLARDGLSLVVNNAAFGAMGPTVDSSEAKMSQMIELNVIALTDLSCAAAKVMIPKRQGGIINVASTAAFQPVPYMNVYSATKAYVLSFTEALAEELKEHGIRVMALCPGPTRTEFHAVAGMREEDTRGRLMMSAAECVRIGLDDFERGKQLSITGAANKLLAFGSWIAPRRVVIKSVGKMMRSRAPRLKNDE